MFSLPSVRVVNSDRKTYSSIAFCSGSGAEFIQDLEKIGVNTSTLPDVI